MESVRNANADDAGGERLRIWVEEVDRIWFALALEDMRFAATAVASSPEGATESLLRHLPRGARYEQPAEPTSFVLGAVRMLAELEAGNEDNKRFELSETYLPPYLRTTLSIAASIPIGYVSTYGDVGSLAGVIARTVGHIMATNPLYPIVPCHRVVGSDMALVGYGGRQDPPALRSKLARLRGEARGVVATEIDVASGRLRLFPVERVIDRAAGTSADTVRQLSLFG